jgi:hypothetical protein
LNYFLGARAAVEGRSSRYPTVDFCKDPEAICASEEHQELKWVAGLFYWRKYSSNVNNRFNPQHPGSLILNFISSLFFREFSSGIQGARMGLSYGTTQVCGKRNE